MGRMTGAWRKIGTAGSRGIALVIVLWGLVLLAVIAAAFTTETRTGVTLARNLVENAKARALADAGVYRAILGLLAPDVEQRWFADAPFYTLASDAGEVRIGAWTIRGTGAMHVAPIKTKREDRRALPRARLHRPRQGAWRASPAGLGSNPAVGKKTLPIRPGSASCRIGRGRWTPSLFRTIRRRRR